MKVKKLKVYLLFWFYEYASLLLLIVGGFIDFLLGLRTLDIKRPPNAITRLAADFLTKQLELLLGLPNKNKRSEKK